MGTKNNNVLCRHCYELFRYDQIGVVCRSRACRHVPDSQGVEGPRYLEPKAYGLWRGRLRPKLVLDEDRECPICETPGKLLPACPICRNALDPTVGQVSDHVIGVIGASESGKSHFLATVLYQFLEAGVGGDVWQVEFASRDDKRIYRREFLRPLFEQNQELRATPASVGPELRLLLENSETGQKALLAFRDLGGELFTDPARLDEVDFLRYAGGVVLITDPLAFTSKQSDGVSWANNGRPTALEVLETYRDVLESRDRPRRHDAYPLLPEEKYLAVAVTKADLILGDENAFWATDDASLHLESGFGELRADENERTREWILRHLGPDLTEVADEFADVSYFFVSSFGYPHLPKTTPTEKPRPKRVHEPIFALLDQLAQSSSSGRGRKQVSVEDDL